MIISQLIHQHIAWYYIVSYCMVWYGMLWYVMVWYGMASYRIVYIHPSIYYNDPLYDSWRGWSQSQLSLGERRDTPWTESHYTSILPHTRQFVVTNCPACLWVVGGSPHRHGESKKQKGPKQLANLNPGTSCCLSANHCSTVPRLCVVIVL